MLVQLRETHPEVPLSTEQIALGVQELGIWATVGAVASLTTANMVSDVSEPWNYGLGGLAAIGAVSAGIGRLVARHARKS